nr:ABC transporter permease [Acidimicrobiia bacterium]
VLAVLSAWRVSRLTTDADDATSSRSRLSLLPRLLGTSPISPAISTGIRSALEPGRGRTAVPVRSALAGIAFGVAGLVAVVVFASSLTELADTPGRYGASWDAVLPGFASRFTDERGAELVDDPTVADLGTVTSVLARLGDEDVPVFAFAPLKGTVSVTLIEGREALREDEVVLGSRTLRDAGLGIGDTFDLSIPTGPVPLRVVGRGAFPVFDERGAVGRGVALTPAGLEALAARAGVSSDDALNETVVVGWAPGVDPVTANAELEERTGTQVLPAAAPADVNNLEQVEDLPRVLAAFLAVMAAVALAHALVTTVRRRRRDLAVLRTFGFVRPQVWAAVGWQAATLAIVGLVVGGPLGIVAGRAAWRVVAAGIGVVDRPADPLLLLGLIGLGVLLTAALVAAPPAYMAGQVRTATALRSE